MRLALYPLVALLPIAACAPSSSPSPPAAASYDCRLLAPAGTPDTVFVGLTQPVDSANAANATNDAEHFLFSAVSDSPEYVDCRGRRNGAAPFHVVSWSRDRIVTTSRNEHDPVVVYWTAGSDPRDLIDRNIDVLLTEDVSVLEYAANREAFDIVPLPWTRMYVFAGPAPVASDEVRAFGERLASVAVRGDVRAAELPFLLEHSACVEQSAPAGAEPSRQQIVYPSRHLIAQDLAERLVALAATGGAFGRVVDLRTIGLNTEEFADALAARRDFGYVLDLPRRDLDCTRLSFEALTPLVDARASIVVRRGGVGIEVTWRGTPRLVWR